MPNAPDITSQLRRELDDTRLRLAEAEETLNAIRNGEVDGLVVAGAAGQQVFTLQGAQEPYRLLIEQMSEGALTLSLDGVILYANQPFAEMLQIPPGRIIGVALRDFIDPADHPALADLLEAALSGHTSKDVSVRTADGSVVLLRLGLNRLQLGVESLLCAVATDITLERKRNTELRHLSETLEARIAERTAELTASRFAIMNMMEEEVESRRVAETANRDLTQQITDRKQAEAERDLLQAQLIQSQKLESVGRLAGGVAHDFNNVLQVIIGNAEYALERTKPSDPIHAELEQINKSGQHAADLTRQLLAFARKQTIQPRKLDLNETLENMLKMLSRLIGENIKLVWKPQAGLWLVRMDPCQIEQILANLCVNARDAIGNFGEVQIATRNVCVDESMALRHEDFPPGDYVLFTISDTGCGMDQETQSHIFEPFFTTKGVGQGTGLGLATVYGIVKQNKGHIGVDSEPGKCTTFRISLPRYLGADSVHSTDSPAKTPVRGHETVMLVEDDLSVLTMVERTLRGLGYTVLSAATPEAALRMAAECTGEFQLLMTDVVMPGMNGRELAGQLKARYPHLKSLFMSGYTADIIVRKGIIDKGVNFIQKPFSTLDLSVRIREILTGA